MRNTRLRLHPNSAVLFAMFGFAIALSGCTYTRGYSPRSGPRVPQRVGATAGRQPPPALTDSAPGAWSGEQKPTPTRREPTLRRCTPAEASRLPRMATTGVDDARWIGVDRYTTAAITLVMLLKMGCGLAVPDIARPDSTSR